MKINVPGINPRVYLLLIVLSFVTLVIAVALRSGLDSTPDETTDSAGRSMGFNDTLSEEHYGIIIRNFRIGSLFQWKYLYEWFLFTMQMVGAWLLYSSRNRDWGYIRCFFASQVLFFPFGLIGLFILPAIAFSLLSGGMDREGFVDVPFIWSVAHPVWTGSAFLIAVTSRSSLSEKHRL